jgi:adenylate cyclase
MEREVAILMADLAGYTAMTDVHGGASAGKIVSLYMETVNRSLHGHAEVIQRIGDQVVITSAYAADLAFTAKKLLQFAHSQHHFLSVHAGLHYGAVYLEPNGIFGSTINIASRIMNIAERGVILCSAPFVGRVADETAFTFREKGKYKLKNVLKEVDLYELVVDEENVSAFHVDPVCHMLLDPGKENHVLPLDGKTYHFCSSRCMELFRGDPDAFR